MIPGVAMAVCCVMPSQRRCGRRPTRRLAGFSLFALDQEQTEFDQCRAGVRVVVAENLRAIALLDERDRSAPVIKTPRCETV